MGFLLIEELGEHGYNGGIILVLSQRVGKYGALTRCSPLCFNLRIVQNMPVPSGSFFFKVGCLDVMLFWRSSYTVARFSLD